MYKKMMRYFTKYPHHNAAVHILFGIGVGFLLTYPVAGTHPVRWGILFIVLGLAGHLWAATQK